jgi:Concanavalin A-like lectin/glucanases superfamily
MPSRRRVVLLCLLSAAAAAGGTYALVRPGANAPRVDVRYRFDAGATGDRGPLPLHEVSARGELSTVEHGDGLAVRFPAPCARYAAPDCPRVVLESGPAGWLNPGTAPITYGAAILMTPSETTEGANVLQKGYSVRDSQFKLQVDGVAGRPSCVMVGTASAHIYAAVADVTVANGRWHTVDCSRTGGSLTVSVDGQVRGQVSLPTTLSVYNGDPLRIGGKGTTVNNDQFTGVVDDAYVLVR